MTGRAPLPIDVNCRITATSGIVKASSQAVARGRNWFRSKAIPSSVEPIRVSRKPGTVSAANAGADSGAYPVQLIQYSAKTDTVVTT